MGVTGLLKLCKEGACHDVSFTHGDSSSLIILDGCFMLHRCLAQKGVASSVHNGGDLSQLIAASVRFVRRLQDAGWVIFIVFDGKTPPAKSGTSVKRREDREKALRKLSEATTAHERDKYVKLCVGLTPRTIAGVARAIAERCGVNTITAPYEADAQLVYVESQLSSLYERCFVYANDSDLVVLGVSNMVYDIKHCGTPRNDLIGKVVSRKLLLNPSASIFADPARGGFLRKLHGVPDGCEDPKALAPHVVDRRLLHLAIILPHDYHKYRGVGLVSGYSLALPPVGEYETGSDDAAEFERLARGLSASQPKQTLEGVKKSMAESVTMFRHSVVFDMHTGLQRAHHALPSVDPEAETEAASSRGEICLEKSTCQKLAGGLLSPITLLPWDPALEDGGRASRPAKRTIQTTPGNRSRKRMPGRPGHEKEPELQPAPAADPVELCRWHVDSLRSHVNRYRCVEKTSVSRANKATLVALAEKLSDMVSSLACDDDRTFLRSDVEQTTPAERLRRFMPGLPTESAWIRDHMALRPMLPEIGEHVIIAHLCATRPAGDYGARNLYRGAQRAYDLGGLSGFSAVLCPPGGGDLWLRLRPLASMEQVVYNVYVRLEVMRVEREPPVAVPGLDPDEEGKGQDAMDGSTPAARMVATRVLAAYCDCKAGADSQCHHIAMLLQLTRLLQMSEKEIRGLNPLTSTGRTCQWILNHCKGGREASTNIWWGRTMPEIHPEYSKLRDPRRKGLGVESDTTAPTAGVVQANRCTDYSPHPRLGPYAELRQHFDEGTSISHTQKHDFGKFFGSVREAKINLHRASRASAGDVPLATDVLPPRTREESTL